MVSWKLFHCRMASPQRGRGLFLRGIECSCNHYFKEWSHDGVVGGLLRMWKSLLCGIVRLPLFHGMASWRVTRPFFPCRILECGIVILEALQSCRWEVQEPRRGKEAGENGVERFGERFCVLARLLTRLLDRFVAVVSYATRLVRRVICSHIKCPRKLLLAQSY